MRKGFQSALLFFLIVCSLALGLEDLDEPWRRLIKTRDYAGAIKILRDSVKSVSSAEDKAEFYYSIGDIHYKYTHDYNKALNAYQQVVGLSKKAKSPPDLGPYMPLSKMMIAAIYQRTNRHQDAVAMYRKVEADYSGTAYALAAIRNIKGIQDALKEIQSQREIIKKHPNFAAEAQFEIAELYLSVHNLNSPKQAIQEYTVLVDQYPHSRRAEEAQLKIGEVYWGLNKPEEAISAYQKLVRKQSSANRLEAEALFRIGRIYYSELLQDYQKALDTFTLFLKDHPTYWKFPAGVYWQGACYEKLGDYEGAVSAFEMFVQFYPDARPGWLADIEQFGRKNVKQRIQSRIEELRKQAPEAKWGEAERLRSQGEYRKALNVYRELVSRYPTNKYAKMARPRVNEVKYLAEIQICQDVIKRKGAEAPASQYRIAEIYELRMRDYPRALKEYEKVARNYSKSHWAADALYKVGLIYSGSDSAKERAKPDYNKAINKFNQLIRKYPKTNTAAKAYYQIGEIYRTNLSDYKRALKAYGKVADDDLYPRQNFYVGNGFKNSLSDESQFKIGMIYYKNLKDYDMALKTFTEFLNDYPDSCRKAAAHSFIAALNEKRNNSETAAEHLEQIIDIIVDSDVQSRFFVQDALYDGSKNQEAGLNSLNIIKQLRRRVSQLRTRVARSN